MDHSFYKGLCGESKVIRYFQANGYQLVAQRKKIFQCEIDIIVKKFDCYFFLEVKWCHRKLYQSDRPIISKKQLQRLSFAYNYAVEVIPDLKGFYLVCVDGKGIYYIEKAFDEWLVF